MCFAKSHDRMTHVLHRAVIPQSACSRSAEMGASDPSFAGSDHARIEDDPSGSKNRTAGSRSS